jgi:hypothetical protein
MYKIARIKSEQLLIEATAGQHQCCRNSGTLDHPLTSAIMDTEEIDWFNEELDKVMTSDSGEFEMTEQQKQLLCYYVPASFAKPPVTVAKLMNCLVYIMEQVVSEGKGGLSNDMRLFLELLMALEETLDDNLKLSTETKHGFVKRLSPLIRKQLPLSDDQKTIIGYLTKTGTFTSLYVAIISL